MSLPVEASHVQQCLLAFGEAVLLIQVFGGFGNPDLANDEEDAAENAQ